MKRRENFIKFMYSEIEFLDHGAQCNCENCNNRKQKIRTKHINTKNGKKR